MFNKFNSLKVLIATALLGAVAARAESTYQPTPGENASNIFLSLVLVGRSIDDGADRDEIDKRIALAVRMIDRAPEVTPAGVRDKLIALKAEVRAGRNSPSAYTEILLIAARSNISFHREALGIKAIDTKSTDPFTAVYSSVSSRHRSTTSDVDRERAIVDADFVTLLKKKYGAGATGLMNRGFPVTNTLPKAIPIPEAVLVKPAPVPAPAPVANVTNSVILGATPVKPATAAPSDSQKHAGMVGVIGRDESGNLIAKDWSTLEEVEQDLFNQMGGKSDQAWLIRELRHIRNLKETQHLPTTTPMIVVQVRAEKGYATTYLPMNMVIDLDSKGPDKDGARNGFIPSDHPWLGAGETVASTKKKSVEVTLAFGTYAEVPKKDLGQNRIWKVIPNSETERPLGKRMPQPVALPPEVAPGSSSAELGGSFASRPVMENFEFYKDLMTFEFNPDNVNDPNPKSRVYLVGTSKDHLAVMLRRVSDIQGDNPIIVSTSDFRAHAKPYRAVYEVKTERKNLPVVTEEGDPVEPKKTVNLSKGMYLAEVSSGDVDLSDGNILYVVNSDSLASKVKGKLSGKSPAMGQHVKIGKDDLNWEGEAKQKFKKEPFTYRSDKNAITFGKPNPSDPATNEYEVNPKELERVRAGGSSHAFFVDGKDSDNPSGLEVMNDPPKKFRLLFRAPGQVSNIWVAESADHKGSRFYFDINQLGTAAYLKGQGPEDAGEEAGPDGPIPDDEPPLTIPGTPPPRVPGQGTGVTCPPPPNPADQTAAILAEYGALKPPENTRKECGVDPKGSGYESKPKAEVGAANYYATTARAANALRASGIDLNPGVFMTSMDLESDFDQRLINSGEMADLRAQYKKDPEQTAWDKGFSKPGKGACQLSPHECKKFGPLVTVDAAGNPGKPVEWMGSYNSHRDNKEIWARSVYNPEVATQVKARLFNSYLENRTDGRYQFSCQGKKYDAYKWLFERGEAQKSRSLVNIYNRGNKVIYSLELYCELNHGKLPAEFGSVFEAGHGVSMLSRKEFDPKALIDLSTKDRAKYKAAYRQAIQDIAADDPLRARKITTLVYRMFRPFVPKDEGSPLLSGQYHVARRHLYNGFGLCGDSGLYGLYSSHFGRDASGGWVVKANP